MNLNSIYCLLSPAGKISRFFCKRKASFVALFHGVHKKRYNLKPKAQRDLTIHQFENIMQWLSKKFSFLTPEEYFNGVKGGVLLTFDDGLRNNFTNALPILEKFKAPAIFFIPSQHIQNPRNWLWFIRNRALEEWSMIPDEVPEQIAQDLYDGMDEEQLKILANNPLITLGAHTVTHPNLITCDYKQIVYELQEAKEYLEKVTNKTINTFAYPQGFYNSEIIKLTQQYYEYGFAVAPYMHGSPNFEIARVSLHNDNPHYLNLKFSSLHHYPTVIES